MKIAVLFQGDLNEISIGGVAEYVKNLIRFKGDNDITLFGVCHTGDYPLGDAIERCIFDSAYTFVPICDDSRTPLSLWFTLALRRNRELLTGYDVIYAQRPEYCLALSTDAAAGRLFQIIHGSSAYTIRPMNRLAAKVYLRVERKSIKRCVRTFVIMKRPEVGLEYYRCLYPDYADRFSYGRIPVDTEVFHRKDRSSLRRRYGIDQERFVIAYAGRVEDYPKRVLLFPDIVERLAKMDPLFVVVGDGSSTKQLADKVESMGLQQRFDLVGYCNDRDRLADYVALSDMTINISAFEGTCTSSLESVACGVPIVSTDVGEIRTIVHEGENGIVIPNGNEAQIIDDATEAICNIHDCPMHMTGEYLDYSGERTFSELFGVFRADKTTDITSSG